MNPLDLISQKEKEYGLPSGLLASVWQQESGKGTDLGLLGPSTKYGRAQGPFQILGSNLAGVPNDFGSHADWAAKYLKEGIDRYGVENAPSYYHGGPNQKNWGPKTARYKQEVLSRLGSSPAGQQPTPSNYAQPESPMANDYQQPSYLTNPLFNMGIGILGQNGRVGPGLQQGLLNLQDARKFQSQQGMQQQQMEMQKQRFAAEQAQRQQAGGQRQKQQAAQQQLLGGIQDPKMKAAFSAYPGLAKEYIAGQVMPKTPETKVVDGALVDTTGKVLYKGSGNRKMAKDASGTLRYTDSGEKVFPGVKAVSPESEKTRFDQSTKLRKEYTAVTGEFAKINDSYGRITASVQDPSPAGDLALIFNYMKMLDPGSVVRESEFAQAAATGAFGERVKAAAGKIVSGERLSTQMRADFANRADRLYKQATIGHKKRTSEFTRLAKKLNLDPQEVIFERQLFEGGAQNQPDGVMPVAGTVDSGYRFKGGDPSNPSNWEQAQ